MVREKNMLKMFIIYLVHQQAYIKMLPRAIVLTKKKLCILYIVENFSFKFSLSKCWIQLLEKLGQSLDLLSHWSCQLSKKNKDKLCLSNSWTAGQSGHKEIKLCGAVSQPVVSLCLTS